MCTRVLRILIGDWYYAYNNNKKNSTQLSLIGDLKT